MTSAYPAAHGRLPGLVGQRTSLWEVQEKACRAWEDRLPSSSGLARGFKRAGQGCDMGCKGLDRASQGSERLVRRLGGLVRGVRAGLGCERAGQGCVTE